MRSLLLVRLRLSGGGSGGRGRCRTAVLVIGRVLRVELDAAVVRGGLGSSGRKVKALAGLDRHPHSLRNRLARLAAREE